MAIYNQIFRKSFQACNSKLKQPIRTMGMSSVASPASQAQASQTQANYVNPYETTPPVSILTGKPYNYADVMSPTKQAMHGFLGRYYKEPLMLTRGKMQHVYDQNGKQYLDTFGGILAVGVGHCHPKVVEKQQLAIQSLTHVCNNYVSAEMYEYLDELLKLFPEGYSAFLVNSGSEANDMAITLAREYTGNMDVFSFRGAYHGMTSTVMGALGNQGQKYKAPHSFGFHKVLNPNPYRSIVSPDKAVEFYANDLKEAIWANTHGQLALFMAESIQGVNGYTEYPEGYLKAAYDIVHAHGGLTLADEVQTGWGRTGHSFWYWEHQGVVPDIVVMAKSMGNGVPVGAVVCKKEIMDKLATKAFVNTFGGNQMVIATSYAVLKTIQEEKMMENSHKLGTYMKDQFKSMMNKYEFLGDVRGHGFLLGLEFVKNKETKERYGGAVDKILEYCKENGVLLGKSGYGNVIRVTPPMCFTKENCDQVLSTMESAFKTI